MARISPFDTLLDVFDKLCEGNPGAITVAARLFKESGSIDPDAAMGGLMPLLHLDTLEIYGPDIWVLYKDVCGQDLVKMCAVIRAWQLGLLTWLQVKELSKRPTLSPPTVDVDAILAKVKAELPRFASSISKEA